MTGKIWNNLETVNYILLFFVFFFKYIFLSTKLTLNNQSISYLLIDFS